MKATVQIGNRIVNQLIMEAMDARGIYVDCIITDGEMEGTWSLDVSASEEQISALRAQQEQALRLDSEDFAESEAS